MAILPRSFDTSVAPGPPPRLRAGGKFLFAGAEKLTVHGVTYGTFRPTAAGDEFPEPAIVERDFRLMAAHGINAVRTYTPPPRWLLDLAWQAGLRVLVGLGAEREVGYLNDAGGMAGIERRIRERAKVCQAHPAILAYAIGNEIPAPVVRWFGPRRVERLLERLCHVVREVDPEGLVTYVNYPSTEYLQLPFTDVVSFNVYIESQARFDAYLPRLQNLAGDRPLLITELGLDSMRNGLEAQATMIEEQVRSAFAWGTSGVFVYAWTDEWHRAGEDVTDWDFGLVRRDRTAKPALGAVRRVFEEEPLSRPGAAPRISIVVCTYNGARTLRDCLEGIAEIDYPNVETIVVDDGSTDATARIAGEYDVRLIRTENRGLSAARNTGWEAATGEIVSYVDDDARPDPQWLRSLAWMFQNTGHVGVGGPNIAPPGDGWIAECVAHSPGGPMHVLVSDTEAEHIPGCNMSFRKHALAAIGGFDPQFRTAGDDVDVCWRLQDRGWTLGFNPGAMVWHHRRNSVRTYWRQQLGYGRAEALLERKWPQRYDAVGHYPWAGRIYGNGLTRSLMAGRGRIYQGPWGSAPFQILDPPVPTLVSSLPLMPEWYLAILGLAVLTGLGIQWPPLRVTWPLLALFLAVPIAQAVASARAARFRGHTLSRLRRLGLTAALHLVQPLARLRGRLRHGLSPWRVRGLRSFRLPRPRHFGVWTPRWRAPEARLQGIHQTLHERGCVVRCGGDYDSWDLEARGGLFGSARMRCGVEEHGQGRQMVRARLWPRVSVMGLAGAVTFAALAAAALLDRSWFAGAVLTAMAAALVARVTWECGVATGAFSEALEHELAKDR